MHPVKGCYAAGGWGDEAAGQVVEGYYWRPGDSKGMISLDHHRQGRDILQALSGGGGCTLSYSFSRPDEHMRRKYEVWCKERGRCSDLRDFAAFTLLKAGIARPFRHGCAATEALSHDFFLNRTLLEGGQPYATLPAHPTAVTELSEQVYSHLHRAGVDGVANRRTSVRGTIVSSCNVEKPQQAIYVRRQAHGRNRAQQAHGTLRWLLLAALVSLLCWGVARRVYAD